MKSVIFILFILRISVFYLLLLTFNANVFLSCHPTDEEHLTAGVDVAVSSSPD